MSLQPSRPQYILLMPNVAVPKAIVLAARVNDFLTLAGLNVEVYNYNFENSNYLPDLSKVDLVIGVVVMAVC